MPTASPAAATTVARPPRSPVKRVGHKGASRLAPGNTPASFDAAADCGVDAIEFDVVRARGRLVVAHSTWEARRRACVTLDDALAHLTSERFAGLQFNVDVRRPGYEAAVVDALHRHGVTDRCLVCSQCPSVLARVRAADPSVRVGLSVGGFLARRLHRWPRGPVSARAAEHIADGRCDAVMAHHSLVGAELLGLVSAAGGELYAWTVDCPLRIAVLVDLGVAGVTTNDPRLFG